MPPALQRCKTRLQDSLNEHLHFHPNEESLIEHAGHTGTAGRTRIKLVASEMRTRLKSSAKHAKALGKAAVIEAQIRAGLFASRQLIKLAKRIERKTEKIRHA